MDIIIEAVISPDGQLTGYHLPPDAPVGHVKLVIQPMAEEPSEPRGMSREEVRAKLLAAGLLSTAQYAPPDAVELAPEELERLAKLFGGGPMTSFEIIDEERGPKG